MIKDKMKSLNFYQKLLEIVLFPHPTSGDIVIVPKGTFDPIPDLPPDDAEREKSRIVHLSRSMFPEACTIHELAVGIEFHGELAAFLQQTKPKRIFIVTPWGFPESTKSKRSVKSIGKRMEVSTVSAAIESLGDSAQFGVLVPSSLFESRISSELREKLSAQYGVAYLIDHAQPPDSLGIPEIHRSFRISTVIFKKGLTDKPITKFFQTKENEQEQLLADLSRLTRQDGGQTTHGYVLRQKLAASEPWSFDRHHPDRQKEQEAMAHYGSARQLGDLVEFVPSGIHIINDAYLLRDEGVENGIPVLEGRDLRSDGSVSKDTRYRIAKSTMRDLLQAGDICVRALLGPAPENLVVVQIEPHMLPLVASDRIIVLRPKSDLSIDQREFLVAYLGSATATKQYRFRASGSISILKSALIELPLPLPDEQLTVAIRGIKDASRLYSQWQNESKQALDALFALEPTQNIRNVILASSRKNRQRLEAAQQIDDFSYRVRTRFPHPLAYRWRIVETQKADREGYAKVLECAEVAACYLACLAILMARNEGIELGCLGNLFSFGDKDKRTSMGEWVNILDEVAKSRAISKLSNHNELYEVSSIMKGKTGGALRSLMNKRNDTSHRRGPENHVVEINFTEAKQELEQLYRAIEFVSEYPLYYVENTQRDSLIGSTGYSFRHLTGDHPLVPLQNDVYLSSELEAGSLYLKDRSGKLHLLRPFLIRRECPECGHWATFYLDSYDKDSKACRLITMEHNHTFTDEKVTLAFQRSGMFTK